MRLGLLTPPAHSWRHFLHANHLPGRQARSNSKHQICSTQHSFVFHPLRCNMRTLMSILLSWQLLRCSAVIDAQLSQAAWQMSPDTGSDATLSKLSSNTCFSKLMHALSVDGTCSKLLHNLAASPTEAQTLRQAIAFELTQCHYFSVDRPCSKCLSNQFDVSCVRALSDAEFGIYTEFLSGE